MELGPGESESASALYNPFLKTLISRDAVYNEVHLWLAENQPDGWLANLDKMSSLGEIDAVLPGHGSLAGSKVLAEDKSYIQDFVKAVGSSRTKEEALEKIKAQYPGYRLPVIAEISIGTVKQKEIACGRPVFRSGCGLYEFGIFSHQNPAGNSG